MGRPNLIITFTGIMLLILAIAPVTKALECPVSPGSTVVRFDPAEVVLGPELYVGEVFTIEARVDDVEDLVGFDFQVVWNSTYLEYVGHTVKIPVETYPDGIIHEPILLVKDEVNGSRGWYWLALTTLGGPPFYGSGIAFEMTFELKHQPIEPEPDVHLQIRFQDTHLAPSACSQIPHYVEHCNVTILAAEYVPFNVESTPDGVTFNLDGASHTTPWTGNFDFGETAHLEMPNTHTEGIAQYYWSSWDDNVTSRVRTVVLDQLITLTAQYDGPFYELVIESTPISGVPFRLNGAPKITPYCELVTNPYWLIDMPESHRGYTWSHWLEDGDTNRVKTVTFPQTEYTAVYEQLIGGTTVSIETGKHSSWRASTILLISLVFGVSFYIKRKKK